MVQSRKLEILDTTLREGEQCFGVFFPIEIKKQIAELLDRIGVDFIEVGHPAAAPSIREAVSEIVSLRLGTRLIAHARLDTEEIQLVKNLGLNWVGLFCGVNEHARRTYGLSKQEIFQKSADALLFAKQLGLLVRFGCEDASRTEPEDLISFYRHLISLGADRLGFADTVGRATPGEMREICNLLKREFPDSIIHFHLHNDSGFAAKNAAVAIDERAACIDASIMGIGERMGILPLEKALSLWMDTGYVKDRAYREKMKLATIAAVLVGSCINREHFSLRRFAHKSGIHINGVVKNAAAYEAVDPSAVGDQRILVLSKLIGKSGIRELLSRNGLPADKEIINSVLTRIKAEELLELFDSHDITEYCLQNRGKHP